MNEKQQFICKITSLIEEFYQTEKTEDDYLNAFNKVNTLYDAHIEKVKAEFLIKNN